MPTIHQKDRDAGKTIITIDGYEAHIWTSNASMGEYLDEMITTRPDEYRLTAAHEYGTGINAGKVDWCSYATRRKNIKFV